ncbi:MAG TPA: hypothetical protein VKZ50_14815 [bacterium]|nr:hypothetical protein [bacterium]
MRHMFGIGLAVWISACMVAIAWAQTSPAPGAGAGILPGRAIGSFQLGEDLAQAVNTLGPVHSQDSVGSTLSVYYWPLRRIGTVADASSKKIVALVVSMDDGYRTDKGIGAGAAVDDVRRAYGTEDTTDNGQDHNVLVYDTLGVAFAVDTTGPLSDRVSEVYVFSPGQYEKIFRQPSQPSGSGG